MEDIQRIEMISHERLSEIIDRAVLLGMQTMMTAFEPSQEYFTRPQLKAFLKSQGIKPRTITMWIDEGVFKDYSTGAGCTHKYKRVDVMKVMLNRVVRSFRN